jgi:Ca2+-binding RTX toxin-like protein
VQVAGINKDVIRNIENITGGSNGDFLVGDTGANSFCGGAGKDTMDGAGGVDTADYSDKTQMVTVTLNGATAATVFINGTASANAEDSIKNFESVIGGSAGDQLTGDDLGFDSLFGNAGDDTMNGRGGKDTLDGGAGAHDTASYSDKTTSVAVTLNGASNATVTVGGIGEDVLRNIENVNGGIAGDALTGDANANSFSGNGGGDILDGMGGNDTLTGGLGADHFRFTTTLNAVTNLDTVADFNHAQGDTIDLDNAVMAALGLATGSLGTQFYSAAGASNGNDADAHIV